MPKDDHRLIAPIYIASFTRTGTAGVKYDQEGTGFGWKWNPFHPQGITSPQCVGRWSGRGNSGQSLALREQKSGG
jgi:hypothetical protein